MTPSELKRNVEETNEHFFSRASMKFAGDTMQNYGVRGPVEVVRCDGSTVECWELYRRKPVKYGLRRSAFFECGTFNKVNPTSIVSTK